MAQPLLSAVQEALDLYPQVAARSATVDEAGQNGDLEQIDSILERISVAAVDAPDVPLLADHVTEVASMFKEAARLEPTSLQAYFSNSLVSDVLCLSCKYLPDETRAAQFVAIPGFVESIAAALVRASQDRPVPPFLCALVAGLCDTSRPCNNSVLLKITAKLIFAPGDLTSILIDAAKFPGNLDSGEENKYKRSAALRALTSFGMMHVPAAARCTADGDLLDCVLAEVFGEVYDHRRAAVSMLTLLADTDHPEVSDRFLASPQAEAAATAALGYIQRALEPDSLFADPRGTEHCTLILSAVFRNPVATPAAVQAAARGAGTLVELQRSKLAHLVPDAVTRAAYALSCAADCDAAWAEPLPADAQVWWARHLEAASGSGGQAPTPCVDMSLHATRAAAAVARRGGAAARTAWRVVEQRPAVLDTLQMQLAETLPGTGGPMSKEEMEVRLNLMTTLVGELLSLLASQANPQQRRVMIRRRHFLSGLAKTVIGTIAVISRHSFGRAAAGALVAKMRAMACARQSGDLAYTLSVKAMGFEPNKACYLPRPDWLPAEGNVMADAFIDNLRGAARVLEVLAGADGADGDAACDALLAACPKEVEELRLCMAGPGGGENCPLFQVSQRLQARKSIPREGGFVPACGCCGATTAALLRCSRCHRVGYCSRECQAKAWKDHKPICQQGGASGSGVASGPVETTCTGAIEMSGVMRGFDVPTAPFQQWPQQPAQPQRAQQQQPVQPQQAQQPQQGQQQQRPRPQAQQRRQQQREQQAQQQQQEAAAAATTSEPAADPELLMACATCGKTEADGVTLKRCAGCRIPFPKYCSAACYDAGWKTHKAACKAARAAQKQQQVEGQKS